MRNYNRRQKDTCAITLFLFPKKNICPNLNIIVKTNNRKYFEKSEEK